MMMTEPELEHLSRGDRELIERRLATRTSRCPARLGLRAALMAVHRGMSDMAEVTSPLCWFGAGYLAESFLRRLVAEIFSVASSRVMRSTA